MSHFTCAVILDERPTDENQLLEKALQPFHEYECTGTVDEYVQSIEELEEYKASYESKRAYTIIQRPDGTKLWPYNAEGNYIEELIPFYVEVEGEFSKRLVLPEGWKTIKGIELIKDFLTLPQYIQHETHRPIIEGDAEPDLEGTHKWGWIRMKDGHVIEAIDRTNPNKQWDCWVIGGRWRGMIVAKDPGQAIVGRDGVMGSNFDTDGVDGCEVGNMDIEAMKAQKVAARRRSVMKSIQKKGIEWNEALQIWQAYVDAQAADFSAFHAQRSEGPVKVFHRGPLGNCWGDWVAGIPKTERDPLAWIERAPPLGCYALLKDGKWYAKGEMGWWGMSDDKHSQDEWDDKFAEMLAELPPEKWLVVVDCHI